MAVPVALMRLASAYGPRVAGLLRQMGPALAPEARNVLRRVLGAGANDQIPAVVDPVRRLDNKVNRLRTALLHYRDAASSEEERATLDAFLTRADRLRAALPLARVGARGSRKSALTDVRRRLDALVGEVLAHLLPPTQD